MILLAVAGSIGSMVKFQKKADQANESQIFVRELALSLKSEDNCTAALQGKTFPTSTSFNLSSAMAGVSAAADGLVNNTLPEQAITFTVPLAASTVTVQPGATPYPSLQVTSVTLLENAQYGEVPFKLRDNTDVKEKLAIVRVRTERLENGVVVGENPPKDIPVKVLLDPSGVIQSCNVSASAALTCEQMGGHWNPTAIDPDQRCIPRRSCQYGGTYSTAPLSQGGYANALTGGFNCLDSSYTAQRTGTVTYATACGKTCVNNFYYPIYTCTRCGDQVALSGTVVDGTTSFQEGDIGGTNQYENDLNNMTGQLNGL